MAGQACRPLTYFTNNCYGSRETAEAATLYLRKIGIKVEAAGVDSAHMIAFNRQYSRDPNHSRSYDGVTNGRAHWRMGAGKAEIRDPAS